MYIAHSNIETVEAPQSKPFLKKEMTALEQFTYEQAYKGHQKALKKYEAEIAEIREVFPDFKIEFENPLIKPKK